MTRVHDHTSPEPPNAPVPFVDLGAMHSPLAEEFDGALWKVIEQGAFILGSEVDAFEREMAAFCGVEHAIGVDSGTSALELILEALEVGPGDEVITAANTFIATALAISDVGATPVLVDVDPSTRNIDPVLAERAITERTRAIIPVHLYGYPAAMDPLEDLTASHGLHLVEDASQAHGARYRGRRVGSIGHVAAFSLYPAKNLGAFGDAGVITTNDPELDRRLRLLRNYGSVEKYRHITKGHNRRLDNLQSAILRIKLRHLETWNDQRREIAARYDKQLGDLGSRIAIPPEAGEGSEPVHHLYVIESDDRDGLRDHLSLRHISTGIHYPVPIHLQPAYSDLGLGVGSFPVTERLAGRILSLPMYPGMSGNAVDRVVAAVADAVS